MYKKKQENQQATTVINFYISKIVVRRENHKQVNV